MALININYESKTLGMPVMINAIIPQGRGSYKTLYLLHGMGGDYTTWITKSRVADYVDNTDIAVIMISGDNKCYVDNVPVSYTHLRRRFMDMELSQLDKIYLSNLVNYNKVLNQRNKLLKDIAFSPSEQLMQTLDIWAVSYTHLH